MNEQSEPGGDPPPVSAVQERIAEAVTPLDHTETLPVGAAIGRPLAEPVTARRALPHYDRVSTDGFAVRAAATSDADPEQPVRLEIAGRTEADPDRGTGGDDGAAVPVDDGATVPVDASVAVPVDDGAPLPDGADAVVASDAVEDGSPDRITVSNPVAAGAGVRAAGSDFEGGETVLAAGRRLRPSDPALCVAVGRTRVEAVQRPTVGIVPTGERLVEGDPAPGEVVETDGRTLSALVERWGGKVTYRDAVDTDPHALRAAVERDLTRDFLVTTGGTGRGSTDRIDDVLGGLGDVRVRNVALEPGGTAGFAVVRERPVVVLPGDPVGCLVAAVTLLGPAVTRLAGRDAPSTPTTDGRLASDIGSERGVRTVVPVAVGRDGGDGETEAIDDSAIEAGDDDAIEATVDPLATPATATQATVARADGWVGIPASVDGRAADETVTVADWETQP